MRERRRGMEREGERKRANESLDGRKREKT